MPRVAKKAKTAKTVKATKKVKNKKRKNRFSRLRGMKDVLFDEQKYWDLVTKKANDLSAFYGFKNLIHIFTLNSILINFNLKNK